MNKNRLNVWNKSYFSNWRAVRSNVSTFFRNIKYSYQRIKYGYCERDLWDLRDFYLMLFYNSLDDFKKDLYGAPVEFFDENKENATEDWENYISEMAQHFYNADEFNEARVNEYDDIATPLFKFDEENTPEEKEVINKWLAREKELYEWRHNELMKGFSMLVEHFEELWD